MRIRCNIDWFDRWSPAFDITDQAAARWHEVTAWQTVRQSRDEDVLVPGYLTEETMRSTPGHGAAPRLILRAGAEGRVPNSPPHLDLAARCTRVDSRS